VRGLAIAVVALIAAVPALAARRAPHPTIGCAHASTGYFSNGFHSSHNVVVSPLALVSAADDSAVTGNDITRGAGWVKNPALVLPGHSVTIAIAAQARGRMSLIYDHSRPVHGPPRVSDGVSAVTFNACDHAHSKSHARTRPVTFFSGGFVAASYPACVPLDITPDKGRRHRVNISLGAGGCP
jgi:hypothetical protein